MTSAHRRNALFGMHTEVVFLPEADADYIWDLEKSLIYFWERLSGELTKVLRKVPPSHGVKFNVRVQANLDKEDPEDEKGIRTLSFWFNSTSKLLLTKSDIAKRVTEALQEIISAFDTFVQGGSGWILNQVLQMIVCIDRFPLFTGGCGGRSFLPPSLRATKSILCPLNCSENDCFVSAVALALCYKREGVSRTNPSRLTRFHKQVIKQLFPPGFDLFPVNIRDVLRFERRSDISVSVYMYNNKYKVLTPRYVSQEKKKYHVDLLLHRQHYYAITNLAAVVRGETRTNTRRSFVCRFCLAYFSSRKAYEFHEQICTRTGQPIKMPPTENAFLRFKNHENMLEAPFVIYADIESAIFPKEDNASSSKKLISTRAHECIAWCCMTVCRVKPELSSPAPVMFVGENSLDAFFAHLHQEYQRISNILFEQKQPFNGFSPEEMTDFVSTRQCTFCGIEFGEGPQAKVCDHCHITGNYRMALCSTCNLTKAATKSVVPVFFHGLMNYDSHFLIQEMHKFKGGIKIIPRNSEKYLAFRVGNYFFKDSYQFLADSLATLASNLVSKGEENFYHLAKFFPVKEKRDLMFRKGVFPYNYITSLDVLKETRLPPKDAFFNDLSGTHISDNDYAFAQSVWNAFECQTLEDYLRVYLLTDVLLLTDCFENFRNTCFRDYGLDPVRYFSLAHYSFDAFLKQSGVILELFTEPNQYYFCNSGIRGGLSMVSKRFSEANNKYLSNYDRDKPDKYILYLDCNNLYGRCMMDFLPCGDFKWEHPIDADLISKILSQPADADEGYILECDLFYPESVHDLHEDYPLAPERKVVPYRYLSPYARALCDRHGLKGSTGTPKLLATLEDKERYVLHYRNLQLYLELGMQLGQVYNVLSFAQKPVFQRYVELNSKRRAASTNAFDVNLYKCMNNSNYGKTLERADNRTIIKLVNTLKKYFAGVSKTTFKSSKIINPNLVSLELKHVLMKVEKPMYLGFVILELAKYYMYQFHYKVMKNHFGERIKLLYTDTDSLVYEIDSEDVYQEFHSSPELMKAFDFSNYPKDHLLFSDERKKIPGYFKDETASLPIEKFIGLRSKMYCIKHAPDAHEESEPCEIRMAKGVKRPVVQNDLRFKHYEECLFEGKKFEHDFHTIKSSRHKVVTSHQSKVSLSSFDDKRWLSDCVHSLPYGHYHLATIATPPPQHGQ